MVPKVLRISSAVLKTHPDSLYRLLRMLASVGIFARNCRRRRGEEVNNNNNENSI